MDEVLLPQNVAISKTKGEVRDVLRVRTVTTTILLFERSAPSQFACTPTALATSKMPLAEAFYSHPTNEALLLPRTSAKRSALTEKTPYD